MNQSAAQKMARLRSMSLHHLTCWCGSTQFFITPLIIKAFIDTMPSHRSQTVVEIAWIREAIDEIQIQIDISCSKDPSIQCKKSSQMHGGKQIMYSSSSKTSNLDVS